MAENKLYVLTYEIPKEVGFILSRFITSCFVLPKFTKCVTVKNTSTLINEEINSFVQLLPLMRFYSDIIFDIVGILEFNAEDDLSPSYGYKTDIAVYSSILHNSSKCEEYNADRFRFYTIENNKLIPRPHLEHTSKAFFHKLDKVIESKTRAIEIEFIAFSNWTNLTDDFIATQFEEIFEEKSNLAQVEYLNISPYFLNQNQTFINSVCLRNKDKNVRDATLKIDIPVYKFQSNSDIQKFVEKLFKLTKILVKERLDFISNMDFKEFEKGNIIDLKKTATKQEVVLKSFLEFSGVVSPILDTKNVVTKSLTKKDIDNFSKVTLETLDNMIASTKKIRVEWD